MSNNGVGRGRKRNGGNWRLLALGPRKVAAERQWGEGERKERTLFSSDPGFLYELLRVNFTQAESVAEILDSCGTSASVNPTNSLSLQTKTRVGWGGGSVKKPRSSAGPPDLPQPEPG